MRQAKAAYFFLITIGVAGCGAQPDGNAGPGTSDDIGVETQNLYSRPLERFYNSSVDRHFYATVRAQGAQVGYPRYEGMAGRCESTPGPDRVRLVRLYNPSTGNWFMTINQAEVDWTLANGWNLQYDMTTDPCYVSWFQTGGGGAAACPMYRLYKHSVHDHFYTMSWNEVRSAQNSFYQYEGVAFYLAPASGNLCPP